VTGALGTAATLIARRGLVRESGGRVALTGE
jgi:hypothetical protein